MRIHRAQVTQTPTTQTAVTMSQLGGELEAVRTRVRDILERGAKGKGDGFMNATFISQDFAAVFNVSKKFVPLDAPKLGFKADRVELRWPTSGTNELRVSVSGTNEQSGRVGKHWHPSEPSESWDTLAPQFDAALDDALARLEGSSGKTKGTRLERFERAAERFAKQWSPPTIKSWEPTAADAPKEPVVLRPAPQPVVAAYGHDFVLGQK
jgi:hypothetical protein